ncbi:rhomboid family intramembrane serine protease [Thermomonas carbonis]|uniref:Rhomboid family intramembrane serine protease n=1 Tax=Thermomonas carbonis TaxID=1463158 RepID=A0A7G9SQ15_9GAMM|nr:rhomboid family intramembrane serine protease [Thermomonas carbonis]QNN69940.1 rhomboid family intramembrane serine protease [Thermomonas carbonis]GHB96495.1 rhomboid family intramembrane serine protease [Thermomonas carbonis]
MQLSLTIVIVALTVLVSWRAFNDRALLERMILWPPALERHKQYDRLLGYGFVHADWMHLIFNMITLWSFGTAVERVFSEMITPVGYVLFYLSAIVVSILPTYITHRNDPNYRSLGASGGVSAVLFAFILFDPWSTLIIFPIPVPIPAFLFAILYVAYSIWMDRRGRDNVNHSAHLWGAAYGLLFTVLLEPRILGHFTQTLFRSGTP